jgi:hypothetical protein
MRSQHPGNVPTLTNAAGAGRIFELYVITGIAQNLKEHGFDICDALSNCYLAC